MKPEGADATQGNSITNFNRRHAFSRILRAAVSHRRSDPADLMLGSTLGFIAGAINAGGFLAVGYYTSHMTGVVSSLTDNLALGFVKPIGIGLLALTAFTAGAGVSAILINWGRRNARARQYAYPLVLEAALLLTFGVLGSLRLEALPFAGIAIPLLCFIMGLQNATITKISGARIRTTHVTGMVTDIGIELGKSVFRHRSETVPRGLEVTADRGKLKILSRIVGMFFLGGLAGALGFGHLGYGFAIPLSAMLLALSLPHLLPSRR